MCMKIDTHTQLKNRKFSGEKELKLACNLTEFPKEIFELCDTLEVLDLTDNNLSALPDNFDTFKKLKILFLSNNQFKEVPKVLAKCPSLTMIGFRNNQIHTLAEDALPLTTRWLILTDNHLKTLPNSIGKLTYLQKCMLSGNELTTLPKTFSQCKNLELLRIAANQLRTFPTELLDLPKLSWLAYGGNPFCDKHPSCATPLQEITWDNITIKEKLGEGASGTIFKAIYEGKEVALKVFKGDMTSDGLPQEEMDINIAMGKHTNLIDVLARVTKHPDAKDVLMLELISASFFNLGLPPTLESCSRDVYPEGFSLTLEQSIKILQGLASAAVHMHSRGIMHGDFYAHNIMIDKDANPILGDFGGASYFMPSAIKIRHALECLEVRAFGYLIEEMLMLSQKDKYTQDKRDKLIALKEQCLTKKNAKRPLFAKIHQIMLAL